MPAPRLPSVAVMSRRAPEPSERVAEILDEDRDPRVLELPATLARGRYGVSRQAVVGVALVVAVAVAMLGGRYLLARGEAAPEPVAASAESGTGEPGAAGESGAAGEPAAGSTTPVAGGDPTAAATPSGSVTVHVVGEVEDPGVVTLDGGARVSEALEEAGGQTSDADLAGVNLARPLVDGEQVVVPEPGEAPATPAGSPEGGGPSAEGGAGGEGTPVDLNTADLTTLETLPGVGPVLAQRIIDWRTEHGRFTAVEELGEVSGVGEKTYAQLAPKVTV